MAEKVVVFDFDGTLSPTKMPNLLADAAGVGPEMRALTERALDDRIDYAESLRRRVALLEGLPAEETERAFERVRLREGVPELVDRLRRPDTHVAVVTSGFEDGVEAALDRADVSVDAVVCNSLDRGADGRLAGTVSGPLVESSKGTVVESIRAAHPEASVAVVGDGANDIPMFEWADDAVGFDPTPAVEPVVDVVVNSVEDLETVLSERGYLDPEP